LPAPALAQPLYVSNGPGGRAALIVATEQNTVLAIDAAGGSSLWVSNLGSPVPRSQLPCGDINPLGITGTPVIDPDRRVIYLDAFSNRRHSIFALSLDDGSVLPGWPLDVSGLSFQGYHFNAIYQNQRGALILNGGILYVPYGGHAGDCGDYRGWLVAVAVGDPASATAWDKRASKGGTWARGGPA